MDKWSVWSPFSSSCGPNAFRERSREILKEAQYGGTCPFIRSQVEKRNNTLPCFKILSFSDFNIPLIELTFPDGSTNNIILGKHEFRNR